MQIYRKQIEEADIKVVKTEDEKGLGECDLMGF